MAGQDFRVALHPSMFRNAPVFFALLWVGAIAGALGARLWLCFACLFILAVWWLKCRATTLTVTSSFVNLRRGILSRAENEVRHVDIRFVQMKQGITQVLFGTGSIAVATAGHGNIEIAVNGIREPAKVRDIINALREGETPPAAPSANISALGPIFGTIAIILVAWIAISRSSVPHAPELPAPAQAQRSAPARRRPPMTTLPQTPTPSPAAPAPTEAAPKISTPTPEEAPKHPTHKGMVIRIVDGDTMMVKIGDKQERIRLRNIDAPEKGEPGFEEATQALLKKFPGGSRVIVTEYARDKYARMIAEVEAD